MRVFKLYWFNHLFKHVPIVRYRYLPELTPITCTTMATNNVHESAIDVKQNKLNKKIDKASNEIANIKQILSRKLTLR